MDSETENGLKRDLRLFPIKRTVKEHFREKTNCDSAELLPAACGMRRAEGDGSEPFL
jgi:hypothetical protein